VRDRNVSLLSAADERACDANSFVVFCVCVCVCVCVSHGAALPEKVAGMNRDFSLASFPPFLMFSFYSGQLFR